MFDLVFDFQCQQFCKQHDVIWNTYICNVHCASNVVLFYFYGTSVQKYLWKHSTGSFYLSTCCICSIQPRKIKYVKWELSVSNHTVCNVLQQRYRRNNLISQISLKYYTAHLNFICQCSSVRLSFCQFFCEEF